MLVSIDPGVKLCGVALWDDGELVNAWLTKGKSWRDTATNVSRDVYQRFSMRISPVDVAIEVPQVYHQSKQKGDPNDLINIALFVGAASVATATGEVHTYRPAEWKKQVPKDAMVERIKKKLTPEERARVDLPRAKGLHHNIWDAVGIGLHHIKRRA